MLWLRDCTALFEECYRAIIMSQTPNVLFAILSSELNFENNVSQWRFIHIIESDVAAKWYAQLSVHHAWIKIRCALFSRKSQGWDFRYVIVLNMLIWNSCELLLSISNENRIRKFVSYFRKPGVHRYTYVSCISIYSAPRAFRWVLELCTWAVFSYSHCTIAAQADSQQCILCPGRSSWNSSLKRHT